MKIIQVNLKQDPYKIFIGSGILSSLGNEIKKLKIGDEAMIISHPSIMRLHGHQLTTGLKKAGIRFKIFNVPQGEESKSYKTAFELLEKIASFDVMKKTFVLAFGGGVIGDLAGFVAAVYKRGIPYVQVPTTLLAQVDSSIGGKVAIDLPVGKNLVGAFHQPRIVFSDTEVLKTLPLRQIRNGMAEVIKYGIIYDKKFFDYLSENYQRILNADAASLEKIIVRSSEIKRDVVLADEKETKGIRTILNFGHTVGHAIEAAGGFKLYQHGEAIALGMRVAAQISFELSLLDLQEQERINTLLTKMGLPEKIGKISLKVVLDLMKHDKKFFAGKNRFVLAKEIGKVVVRESIPLPTIITAIKSYL